MRDITFGTGGWRATEKYFTDERVRMVGQAIGTYLRETQSDTGRPVAVGYDARETSAEAAESIAEVLSDNGFDVLLTDRDLPTPVIAHAIADRNLAGAAVITASHNPPEYNGVKFIPDTTASALPEVTDSIESNVASPTSVTADQRGEIERFNPVSAHKTHTIELTDRYFDVDLSGMTVVYDAIHGSGRDVTDALLESAGATVIRRRCDRDPTFGGQAPEPKPETLAGISDVIEKHDADLGIANDGDADRITVCTPTRGVLNGHLLFAALFDALLGDGGATGPAIRTVSTTFLIDRIADAYDVDVHEVPVGFKWIADGMKRHSGLFGGEESGGFTVNDHIGTKDGVLMALFAAAVTAIEPIDDRLDRLLETHGQVHANKLSVDCPDEQKTDVIAALENEMPETIAGQSVAETVSLDGFKFLLDGGSWVLVRPSGTEPKLRIYAETTDDERLGALLDAARELLTELTEATTRE